MSIAREKRERAKEPTVKPHEESDPIWGSDSEVTGRRIRRLPTADEQAGNQSETK